MQTFLPYPDFAESARVLDMKRLGKQRVEALQISYALTRPEYGWQSHPAVKMWRDCTFALTQYGIAVCDEWISRGYKDTCREKLNHVQDSLFVTGMPHWLGDEALHKSHRSNLLRKAPEFYSPLFESDLPNDLEYVWPMK